MSSTSAYLRFSCRKLTSHPQSCIMSIMGRISLSACLLFFLLFARQTCAEQSRITVVNEWNTGFTAKFTFRLQSKVTDGWIITLTFSKPALKLQTWIGDIKSVSPDRKRYVITNKPWQKQLNAGYELSTEIVLTKPVANSPAPGGVALFQRLGAGAGGGAGGGNAGGGGGGHTGGGGGVIAKPTAPPAPGPFNYNEVLRKSILFYEAQRAGRLPATNRIPWRKSATLRDGADVGVDLSGGWFDAGDFVKFGFPMASSVTVLTWGLLKYKEAYIAAGELKSMLDCIKWPLDYFMKAHTSKFELYVQVRTRHFNFLRRVEWIASSTRELLKGISPKFGEHDICCKDYMV